jgi:predicted secreted protein
MNLQHCLASLRLLAAIALTPVAVIATAQVPAPSAPSPPTVTVTATATTTVANDRLQAWLRAEAENVSPAAAASQANAAIARALADAKAYAAVKVATAGYGTQQIAEKGKPTRWRVTQSISLESSDFTQAATLISRLQDEGGLLLSSMGFSISERARREAEDSVTQQALKSWQARAQQAALGLGFSGWRVGRVTVQTSGGGPAYSLMRAQAMASPGGAPVALEAGTTEVTVTVSGDALLQ